jgi:hypothetical protein
MQCLHSVNPVEHMQRQELTQEPAAKVCLRCTLTKPGLMGSGFEGCAQQHCKNLRVIVEPGGSRPKPAEDALGIC